MKKSISIYLVLLFMIIGRSEAQFSSVWSNFYQHSSNAGFSNEARKVVTDQAGNIFVAVDVTSDLDMQGNVQSAVFDYVILLKYSPAGVLLNQASIDVIDHSIVGFDLKSVFGLELDAAGNVYVGYNLHHPSTNFDVRVTKFDNNLSPLQVFKHSPGSNDFGIDMKVAANGVVYMTVRIANGNNIVFSVLKSDASLSELISIQNFTQNIEVLNSMTIDNSQNIYVTGYQTVGGFKNVLTAAISNSGTLLWKNIYNGGTTSRDDFGKTIALGADGYLYVVGTSDRGAPNGTDVAVIKYYPGNGKKIWVVFEHNNAADQGFLINANDEDYIYTASVSGNSVVFTILVTSNGARKGRAIYNPNPANPHLALNGATVVDIAVSTNSNFYLTGRILSTDVNGDLFSSSYLVKYNLEPRGRGGLKLEFANTVEGAVDENYEPLNMILDETNANLIWLRSYYRLYTTHGTEGIILDKFSIPAPVKIVNNTVSSRSVAEIFPNPFNEFVNVSSIEKISKIELYEVTGKQIMNLNFNSENISIELKNLDSGIYFLKYFYNDGTSNIKKIVKN